MADANLAYINVSLESLDPATYERLRRGASFLVFMRNLETLAEMLRRREGAPELRFTTMLLRDNADSIPALIEQCKRVYGAELHEVRAPFAHSVNHMDPAFVEASVLPDPEFAETSAPIGEEEGRVIRQSVYRKPMKLWRFRSDGRVSFV
jgi:MoaA/NifB/PqqE/SkfB family radical SAM enzyme